MSSPATAKKGTRKDPVRRPLDALGDPNRVVNPKPGMRYVLVSQGSELRGPDYYEMLGYGYVNFDANDPKATRLGAGKWKDGEKVGNFGQFLMCITEEDFEPIYQYGPNGKGGQEYCDTVARLMNDRRRGGADPLQSRHGIIAAQMASHDTDESAELEFLGG